MAIRPQMDTIGTLSENTEQVQLPKETNISILPVKEVTRLKREDIVDISLHSEKMTVLLMETATILLVETKTNTTRLWESIITACVYPVRRDHESYS